MLAITTVLLFMAGHATSISDCDVKNDTVVSLLNENNDSTLNNALEFITMELDKSCGIRSAVILSNSGIPFLNDVIHFFSDVPISIIHHDLQSENVALADVIVNSYIDLRIHFFVILLNKPEEVMDKAATIFRDQERGRTAMMTHRTKWLIFLQSPMNESHLENFRNSLFDNVCIINLSNCSGSSQVGVNSILTLMWRAERSREFDIVDMSRFQDNCVLFPNTKHGLNKRNFYTLTKFYFSDSFIKIHRQQTDTEPKYSGVYYDVMEVLAQSLNFTFSVTVTNISWGEYRKQICHGHYDIGLSFWRVNNEDPCPMATTYPLDLGAIRGMYHKPEPGIIPSPLTFTSIYPLPTGTLWIYLPALLISPLFYLFVKHIQHCYVNKCKKDSYHLPHSKNTNFVSGFKVAVKRYIATVGQYFGSSLSQSTLPVPSEFVTRIQVWAWGITMVLLGALYGGFMTSERVRPREIAPFHTYIGMLQRGDYRWGSFNAITVAEIMKRSKDDVLRQLGEGMLMIDIDQEEIDVVTKMKTVLSFLDDNFVIIANDGMSSFVIENIRQLSSTELIMMKEQLFYLFNGYVLPFQSEITDVLSDHSIILHDSGIRDRIFNKYSMLSSSENQNEPVKENKFIVSNDVRFPLIILFGALIVLCFFILLLEHLYAYVMTPLFSILARNRVSKLGKVFDSIKGNRRDE